MIFRGTRTGDDFERDCLLENTASGFHGGPFPLQCTYFKEEAILLIFYIYQFKQNIYRANGEHVQQHNFKIVLIIYIYIVPAHISLYYVIHYIRVDNVQGGSGRTGFTYRTRTVPYNYTVTLEFRWNLGLTRQPSHYLIYYT